MLYYFLNYFLNYFFFHPVVLCHGCSWELWMDTWVTPWGVGADWWPVLGAGQHLHGVTSVVSDRLGTFLPCLLKSFLFVLCYWCGWRWWLFALRVDLCFNSGVGSAVGCVCPWGHARGGSDPGWRTLAGLEVPGVPCAHCSGSWVWSSLLMDTLCSQ